MISTYISKNDSNAIKGVAILFMLFFHLFNRVTDGVIDYWIVGQSFTKWLTPAAYPVPFFLMMSRYGLFFTYINGKLNVRSNLRRVLKLYIHYWLVMLIFVIIGCFIAPWHYPGSLETIFRNVTGVHCSYNYETWFLLPYVILCFLSPWIFSIMERIGSLSSLCLALLFSLGAQYCISRYVATGVITNPYIQLPLTTCGLLLSFVLGACMMIWSKSRFVVEKSRNHSLRKVYCVLLLIVLMALRCLIHLPWATIYTFLFILIYVNMPRYNCVDKVLMEFGKKSMVMWMVHTYFSIYLFHDFIYGFKYPVLIYLVLLFVSYFTSLLLMELASKLSMKIIRF